jgi:chromosome segregation ATPase
MIKMEQKPDDLTGMDVAGAKEYIIHYSTALKLTEKKGEALDQELAKWNARIALARSKGAADLANAAEQEAEKIKVQQAALSAEIAELKAQIERMRKQLPGLAARTRSIDPDLLEQELIMAAGYLPGEEEKAGADRHFRDMEKDANAALEVLKAKMNGQES